MSGHSKWSQIKYKKAIEDAKRAKVFSKLSRLITLAAREKGGDPEKNSDLKAAIEKARSFNMPQENIERAIKRGTGEIEGGKLENFLIEALGPGGISVLIEVVTDNKNRSLSEIRKIIEECGGKMVSGSVIWKFQKMGKIEGKPIKEKEEVELLAIESGVEDIKERNGFLLIYTLPEKLSEVKEKIKEFFEIENFSIEFVPKEEISFNLITEEEKNKIKKLFEKLDEHDDVQEIYSDLKEEEF